MARFRALSNLKNDLTSSINGPHKKPLEIRISHVPPCCSRVVIQAILSRFGIKLIPPIIHSQKRCCHVTHCLYIKLKRMAAAGAFVERSGTGTMRDMMAQVATTVSTALHHKIQTHWADIEAMGLHQVLKDPVQLRWNLWVGTTSVVKHHSNLKGMLPVWHTFHTVG